MNISTPVGQRSSLKMIQAQTERSVNRAKQTSDYYLNTSRQKLVLSGMQQTHPTHVKAAIIGAYQPAKLLNKIKLTEFTKQINSKCPFQPAAAVR